MLYKKSHNVIITYFRRFHTDNNFANNVLFEDKHFIVVNKQPRVLVQNQFAEESLFDEVKAHIIKCEGRNNPFVGIVHRLDRSCSGVIIFAKRSKAASRLSEQIRGHKITKKYLCIVNGKIKGNIDCITHYHIQHPTIQNKVMVRPVSSGNDKEVKLYYDVIDSNLFCEKYGNHSLIEVRLITGRKHQIRAQLGFLGHPILGDVKYGCNQNFKIGDLALHAVSTTLQHPISKENMTFVAEIPGTWKQRYSSDVISKISKYITRIKIHL